MFRVRSRKGGREKGNKRAPLNVPSLVGNYKKVVVVVVVELEGLGLK